jgi:hypothetical protein
MSAGGSGSMEKTIHITTKPISTAMPTEADVLATQRLELAMRYRG